MKWYSWLSIGVLALFIVTLFLPQIKISGERYVSVAEDVNQHLQDREEDKGEDSVSPGAVSAAAVEMSGFDDDENRDKQVDDYDKRIEDELDSDSMNGLFLGKWLLTVDDTLYFDGAVFQDEKKIEDSGVQSVFKWMGVLIYLPILLAVAALVLCILNKRANEWILLALGVLTGGVQAFWYFLFPRLVWGKISDYVNDFTSISKEVLHSDGMGNYTIGRMISHFSAWGHIVNLVFAVLFVVMGVLLLTVFREKHTSFSEEMPNFSSGKVTCISGEYQGCSFDLRVGEEFIIGRDPKYSQLILSYSKISRRHCGIKYNAENGSYLVKDYSSNGTMIAGGGKVASTHFQELPPGAVLYLATEKESFRLD